MPPKSTLKTPSSYFPNSFSRQFVHSPGPLLIGPGLYYIEGTGALSDSGLRSLLSVISAA
jgi:hypothetical protein